jgi:tripartite-type tricarboxylate transporter receptor subunit TctC
MYSFRLGSIRIMAPYAPGGNIDVTARIIADKLKDVLGVPVLVENKAGASGMIGSDVVDPVSGAASLRASPCDIERIA